MSTAQTNSRFESLVNEALAAAKAAENAEAYAALHSVWAYQGYETVILRHFTFSKLLPLVRQLAHRTECLRPTEPGEHATYKNVRKLLYLIQEIVEFWGREVFIGALLNETGLKQD